MKEGEKRKKNKKSHETLLNVINVKRLLERRGISLKKIGAKY